MNHQSGKPNGEWPNACDPVTRCDGAPTVAVVICTRDRPEALVQTLDSLWSQTRLPDELIIVDDGALLEATLDRLSRQCQERDIIWRYKRSGTPGLTSSRNLAAEIASSDVLQYLDDDVTCETGFLAEVSRLMADPLIAGVTATVREPAFETKGGRLYQLGYQLAGWWRVVPRGRPSGPRPRALSDATVATRARWLSGAAMALRRDVVAAERFDEGLTDYALGEDREMGYRLSPRYWLVEAKRAHVIHRRETSQRTDSRRLGFMTSYNYLRILRKTCRLGVGDWFLIAWGLSVVGAMHAAWSLLGDRRAHLSELVGMAEGVLAFIRCQGRHRKPAYQCSSRDKDCTGGQAASGTHSLSGREASSHRTSSHGTSRQQAISHKDDDAAMRASIRTKPLSIVRPALGTREPTRVLFVTTTLDAGGAELMLLSLVKHLDRRDVQPYILCLKDAGNLAQPFRESDVPVFEGVLRFKTDAAVLLRIRRLLVENEIDVVVVAHSGGDRMFWGTLAARAHHLPVVVWSHWFPTPGHKHFESANRALFCWVDVFVAIGEKHRLALIRHAHVPAGRITVIHNAIEVNRFLGPSRRDEARRRLHLSEGQLAVGIVANMRPEKRHDVFIEAARLLAPTRPGYRFFIIGGGPEQEAVRAAASRSSLDHETLQLLGPRDDVSALLPGLDIACLCSEVECFSVSMLEAAAAGCAFIGPDVGCLTEFLAHRQTGFVIRPADVGSLTDAIAELGDAPDLRARVVRAAQDRVVRSFGADKMAGAFADLIVSLYAGHRKGGGRA